MYVISSIDFLCDTFCCIISLWKCLERLNQLVYAPVCSMRNILLFLKMFPVSNLYKHKLCIKPNTRSIFMHVIFYIDHIDYFFDVFEIDTCHIKPEGDSGSYGSVGSPVGGPECRSDYDGLQAQCDQAMHQLQLLRHKHSDTIRRFVLILFYLSLASRTFFLSMSLSRHLFISTCFQSCTYSPRTFFYHA